MTKKELEIKLQATRDLLEEAKHLQEHDGMNTRGDIQALQAKEQYLLDQIEQRVWQDERTSTSPQINLRSNIQKDTEQAMQNEQNPSTNHDEHPQYREMFREYLLGKISTRDMAQEMRVLQPGSQGANAVLPNALFNQLQEKLAENSRVQQLCDVISTAGGITRVPVEKGFEPAGEQANTAANIPDNDNTLFEEVALTYQVLGSNITVNRAFTEDAFLDIESYLIRRMGIEIAMKLDREILDPENGTLRGATSAVTTDTNNKITHKELLELKESVLDQYHDTSSFLTSQTTRQELYGISDNNGHPLYLNAILTRTGDNLIGYPVYATSAFPKFTKNKPAIAWGDFRMAIKVFVARNVTVTVDPYTLAHQDRIRYIGSYRAAGAFVNTDAVKLLKLKA